jgi:membrane fusion protein, multidrug efflux system
VQRVPVKIVLDDHRLTGLLRPGMSAEPTVNTKATVLAEREANRRVAQLLPSLPAAENGEHR